MRKRENKNYRFVPFRSYLMRYRKLQKKIAKKLKKHHYGFILSQNRLENAEKERKKLLSFCFIPTQRVIENSKNKRKKFKKNTIMAPFQATIG